MTKVNNFPQFEPTRNLFSPINIENIKLHCTRQKLDQALVEELDHQFDLIGHKNSLSKEVSIELIMHLLQINVVQMYPPEHISPKFIMMALILLKASLQFAEDVAINNYCIASQHNIKTLKDLIKTLSVNCNVDINKVPGLIEVLNSSKSN